MNDLITKIEQMQKEARDGMKRASRDSDPYLYQYMVGKFHAFGKVAGMLKKQMKIMTTRITDSEDERIRNEIIEFIRSQIEDGNSAGWDRWIAYLEKQKEPENISASTMIPSFHEELTEFELVLFNAVLDNNFVGAKGSENALAMTKKVAPQLLAIAKKEPDWDREKCFVCQEYEKGFKQGHLEGCTAGYNKAMKEVDEQKAQKAAEWSEEDERLINTSISFLKDFADKGYENAVECIDWLKSLRDLPKQPGIFDTIAFQKGVAEGKRLMMEGATYNELMELYRAIRDELVKRHCDVPVNIKEEL